MSYKRSWPLFSPYPSSLPILIPISEVVPKQALSCNPLWRWLFLMWHHFTGFRLRFLHSFQRLFMPSPRWCAALGWGSTRFSVLVCSDTGPFRGWPEFRLGQVAASLPFLFLLESCALLESKFFGSMAVGCVGMVSSSCLLLPVAFTQPTCTVPLC